MVYPKGGMGCESQVGLAHTRILTCLVIVVPFCEVVYFLFARVQYTALVCVYVCVGVRGRECSHETSPSGTDNTAVLS